MYVNGEESHQHTFTLGGECLRKEQLIKGGLHTDKFGAELLGDEEPSHKVLNYIRYVLYREWGGFSKAFKQFRSTSTIES